jgi:hypothetical protein
VLRRNVHIDVGLSAGCHPSTPSPSPTAAVARAETKRQETLLLVLLLLLLEKRNNRFKGIIQRDGSGQNFFFFFNIFWGDFLFFSYIIQHCFNCRPSDSIVSTDARMEPKTVATGALEVRRSNH